MNARTADRLCLLLLAAVTLLAAWLYADLPERIPTHWNAAGEVDGYTAKPWGALLPVLGGLLVWGVMKLIPAISPKGYRTDAFAEIVNLVQVVLVAFMTGVAALVLLSAYGLDVHINESIFIGVGLLLFVLGNYMTKMRKNFFLGIRTPWTLASDEVWARTHRLGGRLFMVGGLMLVLSAFFRIRTGALLAVVLVVGLVPVIYSYFAYRSIEGFGGDGDEDGGSA